MGVVGVMRIECGVECGAGAWCQRGAGGAGAVPVVRVVRVVRLRAVRAVPVYGVVVERQTVTYHSCTGAIASDYIIVRHLYKGLASK